MSNTEQYLNLVATHSQEIQDDGKPMGFQVVAEKMK